MAVVKGDPFFNLNHWFADPDETSGDEELLDSPLTLCQWADNNAEEIGDLYRDIRDRLSRTGSRLLCNMSLEDFYDVCEQFSVITSSRKARHADTSRLLLPG